MAETFNLLTYCKHALLFVDGWERFAPCIEYKTRVDPLCDPLQHNEFVYSLAMN